MMLEGSAQDAQLVSKDDALPTEKSAVDNETLKDMISDVWTSDMPQRDIVTATAVSDLFRIGAVGKSCIPEARAMLLHCILLEKVSLSDRATDRPEDQDANYYLCKFFASLYSVLESPSWHQIKKEAEGTCNLGDCIDGRLFYQVYQQIDDPKFWASLHPSVIEKFNWLARVVSHLAEIEVFDKQLCEPGIPREKLPSRQDSADPLPHYVKSTVLPFKNPVFDSHLKPIRLDIDSSDAEVSQTQSAVFRELKNWHNKKRGNQLKIQEPVPEHIKTKIQKRNQYFLTDMSRYAASLTNATGGELHPEPIYVTATSSKKTQKPKISGKHNNVVAMAAASVAAKQAQNIQSAIRVLKDKITEVQLDPSLQSQYEKAGFYLLSLPDEKRSVMEAELKVYMVHILVQIWMKCCKEQKKAESMHIATLIWKTVTELMKMEANLTMEMSTCINRVIERLKLPKISLKGFETRKMSFGFVDMGLSDLSIGMSPTEFQLMHAGPYMDRSMGSAQDPRIRDFQPDEWQRKVLDQIDAKKSLFVVAPTSAGKTFIS